METVLWLSNSLHERVCAHSDSRDIIEHYNNSNKDLEYFHCSSSFRLLMCAATYYNHTALLELLLVDPRCDLDAAVDGLSHPLLEAIRTENINMVGMYLKASKTISVLTKHHCDPGAPLNGGLDSNGDEKLTDDIYSSDEEHTDNSDEEESTEDTDNSDGEESAEDACNSEPFERISAVVYACLYDRLDILQLLLDYYIRQPQHARFVFIFIITSVCSF